MKLYLTILTFVAAAHGANLSYLVAPTLRSYPYVYGSHTTSVITPVQHQYHTQDELGQYAYGYTDPLSTKQEVRSLDGVTRGSYSYRDADGILQTVDYTADDSGFHVSATNLPKPVQQQGQVQQQQQLQQLQQQQDGFRGSESPVSDSVSPITISSTATNTISTDTDTESIAPAGAFNNEIYTRNGLRLAESAAAHTKPISVSAHVRSMELYPTLADSLQVAPTSGLYVSTQPRKVLTTAPVAVAVPVAKTLIPKVYGFRYPLGQHYFYY